nr:restriction endonuclease subunit S [Clostridia bacterium]
MVSLPSVDEQRAIGEYLEYLDTLITLHQREESCAASFSASCFGTLKAFFWEQRKLLDCILKITDFRGRTPKKLGMDWSESGYLALSALNVKDGYIDFDQDVHYGDQALYDKWMAGNELHQGQVLFTTEAPMGNVAQIPDNRRYILSQRTIAFDVVPKIITENFLATILRTPAVFATLTALSSGGTAKGVSQKSLATVDITIPANLEEQDRLASVFSGLDTLITLHQCKPKSRKGGSHVLYSYQV